MEWDRARTIMFAVVKGAGSKVKSPKDLITIPELDGKTEPVRENLIKRLKEFNAKAQRTD